MKDNKWDWCAYYWTTSLILGLGIIIGDLTQLEQLSILLFFFSINSL